MRVMVTGAAGYIGSVLCGRLLEAGHSVTAVDTLVFGPRSLLHLSSHERFEFARVDVRDERAMRPLVAAADAIVPLAALVGAPLCDRDPWAARAVNHEAVVALERMRDRQQLVVFPTTNSGYGTRSGDVLCTEDTPLEPISLYGRTKVDAEAALLARENTITLRLATVFGVSPRMRVDLLVNHFVYAAVTDGYLVVFEKDFKRNFVHIQDVADCMLFCLENGGRLAGRAYNVGLDDANLSKEQLALKVKEHVPRFFVHFAEVGSDPDKRNYVVSNQRMREAGFQARRSLDDGIRDLLKAYRMFGASALANA